MLAGQVCTHTAQIYPRRSDPSESDEMKCVCAPAAAFWRGGRGWALPVNHGAPCLLPQIHVQRGCCHLQGGENKRPPLTFLSDAVLYHTNRESVKMQQEIAASTGSYSTKNNFGGLKKKKKTLQESWARIYLLLWWQILGPRHDSGAVTISVGPDRDYKLFGMVQLQPDRTSFCLY